jgi:predicted porin
MKKSLIALAVLGLSSAVMAQSSVTLYGVADAGLGKAKYDGDDKAHFISGGTMNNGPSRIGVRGVEDLGGGLRVGFNFESGLDLASGANFTSGTGFWGRNANMWIGGNWGTFKMGRSLNPTFYGMAAWELTGLADYSVVANTYFFAGSGPRNSGQFSYATPNISGFSAELGYITKHDNLSSVGNSKWDLNVQYANGPIGAALTATKTQHSKTSYSLGGNYKFGNFALAASYTSAANGDAVRRGFGIGGTATFGAASVTLDLTRDTKNQWGAKKYTNALLEGKYALSKRTFIYAAYLRIDSTNNYGVGVRHDF